jgi:hypothetical protein
MKNLKFILLALLALQACVHEPDLSSVRDISYSTEIAPIIAGNCSSSGCHANDAQSEFSLVGYDDLISNGDVKPGNAKDSEIYQVLFETGDDKMPPNGDLTDRQKKLIFIWIEQGAKNN